MPPIDILFLLIVFHFVADFGLQSAYMAVGKNRIKNTCGEEPWYYILFAHCAIHGAFVYLATGKVWLGVAEIAVHFLIDDAKCRGKFGMHVDQGLHIACKLVWFALLFATHGRHYQILT